MMEYGLITEGVMVEDSSWKLSEMKTCIKKCSPTIVFIDYKTDITLRKELKKYTGGSTNLIVAQRIGTILNADKIIVLEKGRCVGIGTHKELMKTCDVYKEIALSQVSKEELENAG